MEIDLLNVLSIDYLMKKCEDFSTSFSIFTGFFHPDGHCLAHYGPLPDKQAIVEGISRFFSMPSTENDYILYSSDSTPFAILPLLIRESPLAFCVLCDSLNFGASSDAKNFERACSLVSIFLENVSDYIAQSTELISLIDETDELNLSYQKDSDMQAILGSFLSKINAMDMNDDIIPEIFAQLGSILDYSRIYLYEPAGNGNNWQLSKEWHDITAKPLDTSAHYISSINILLPDYLPDYPNKLHIMSEECEFFLLSKSREAVHFTILNNGVPRWIAGFESNLVRNGAPPQITAQENDEQNLPPFSRTAANIIKTAVLRKNTHYEIKNSEKHITDMLENLHSMVYVADYNNRKIIFNNTRLKNILNNGKDYTGGSCWSILGQKRRCEHCFTDKGKLSKETLSNNCRLSIGQRWYHHRVYTGLWHDGRKVIYGILTDINDFVKQEKVMAEYDDYDPLLKIYSRKKFEEDLEKALKKPGALISFDINDFNYINDTLGYDAADALLERYVRNIEPLFKGKLYRVGGDELMVILADIGIMELRDLVGDTIALQNESLQKEEIGCVASIGVASFPEDGHSVHDILYSVEAATSHAKRTGTGTAAFFRYPIEDVKDTDDFYADTMKNEAKKEFSNMKVLYHPIIDNKAETITAVYADILFEPYSDIKMDDLVRYAAKAGVASDITNWFFKKAVTEYVNMNLPDNTKLVLPLFTCQLRIPDMARYYSDLLSAYGCPLEKLIINISERLTLYDFNSRFGQLRQLKDSGVTICACHFGKTSPKHFTMDLWDMIMLDREIVQNILEDSYLRTIVKTRIQLAHASDMLVCAEGVDSFEIKNLLLLFGCDLFTGNFFPDEMLKII